MRSKPVDFGGEGAAFTMLDRVMMTLSLGVSRILGQLLTEP
jgi:hypothetical protein